MPTEKENLSLFLNPSTDEQFTPPMMINRLQTDIEANKGERI